MSISLFALPFMEEETKSNEETDTCEQAGQVEQIVPLDVPQVTKLNPSLSFRYCVCLFNQINIHVDP